MNEKSYEKMLFEMEYQRLQKQREILYRDNWHSTPQWFWEYERTIKSFLLWGRNKQMSNYQLWKLRQEVLRHLSTHNIEKENIPMETTIPCHNCDNEVEPDEAHIIYDEAYCDSCVFVCECCEEEACTEDAHTDGRITICQSCYDDNYITCEDCDRLVHTDDYVCVRDTYLCMRCYEHGSYHYCNASGESEYGCEEDCEYCNGSDEYLHNYNYKPDPLFHDTRTSLYRSPLPNTLYMGVELETTPKSNHTRNDAAEYIGENISEDLLYLKEDSSVSNGFEIVTHPMTLHWARNNFPWEMLTKISDLGMHAWNDYHCGLHIHISRTAFRSHSHLAKLLLFIYRNSEDMIKFTGRNSVNYANYDSSERRNFVSRAKGETQGYRHVAVNLQNTHTVELRVFRPSLLPTTVQAYLEFCDALVRYAGTITVAQCVKQNALSFAAFSEWLITQTEEDYSILHARINKRVFSEQSA